MAKARIGLRATTEIISMLRKNVHKSPSSPHVVSGDPRVLKTGKAARPPLTIRGGDVFVLLLVFFLSPFVQAEELTENQARIGAVKGDVGFLAQGALEWIEAKEGLPLEAGDKIRTGEDGRVELVVGEYALWKLEPHTELLTEHMEQYAGRFQLSSGTLLGSVDSDRATGHPQKWEINTPVAVVAIRGTSFVFRFTRTEGAQLSVYEGVVEMEPAETAQGKGQPIHAQAGQEILALRGKPLHLIPHGPFSRRFEKKRSSLRRRHAVILRTWTPFTPTVRNDLRKKVVAPPPKRPIRRLPPRYMPKSRRLKQT
jgi:hypothetical protein